uniref:Putative capsid protein n=1 Tax=viral metagenome TaxID=1070528 RepID=A0A6M3XVL1_9ZZZZ
MVNYSGPNLSTADYSRVLEVACKEEFFKIYENAYWKEAAYKTLCTTTSSDGDTEYYGFGGALPLPGRIDNDSRIHYGFDDESYTLQNYTYGLSIDIHRKVIEDDRHGFVRGKFAEAAVGHAIILESNFMDTVEAGTSATCHDSQYFFDSDHTSSQDNTDQNQAVATADMATTMTSALAVAQTMKAFADPNGVPLNIAPTHVLTGNGDTSVAWDMLVSTPGAVGTANAGYNPFYNRITVVKSAHAATTTEWFYLDLSKPYKPFIFQSRYGLEIKTNPPDAKSDNYVTSTYERYRYGYGPWYLAIIGDA